MHAYLYLKQEQTNIPGTEYTCYNVYMYNIIRVLYPTSVQVTCIDHKSTRPNVQVLLRRERKKNTTLVHTPTQSRTLAAAFLGHNDAHPSTPAKRAGREPATGTTRGRCFPRQKPLRAVSTLPGRPLQGIPTDSGPLNGGTSCGAK